MNKIIILVLLALLTSCSKKTEPNKETGEVKRESVETPEGKNKTGESSGNNQKNIKIFGYYTGGFEAVKYDETKDYVYENRITISLDSIAGTQLFGHSIVAGNNRPLAGSFSISGSIYSVNASEPGDDKYDGKFSFKVLGDSGIIEGKWIANDPKLMVSERKYRLTRREFKYDPNLELPEDVQWAELYTQNPKFPDKVEQITGDVVKLNASARLLSKQDVENLYKGDLEIIRNSIYARHGYSFKTRRIRFIFDQFVEWYMPVTTDVRNDLTETEKKNIDLIKRYEEHAEKYYDEYGR